MVLHGNTNCDTTFVLCYKQKILYAKYSYALLMLVFSWEINVLNANKLP